MDYRELRRVVYIPFLGDSIAGATPEALRAHVKVKKSINSSQLSRAVGTFIATGRKFRHGGWNEIVDDILPAVQACFQGKVLSDCALPYATLLWFTKEVHNNYLIR